jgi:hypothetical protein
MLSRGLATYLAGDSLAKNTSGVRWGEMLDKSVLDDRPIPGAKDPNGIMTVTDRLMIRLRSTPFRQQRPSDL